MKKSKMSQSQMIHMRGDFTFTYICKCCGDNKPSGAYRAGSGGTCNTCRKLKDTKDQTFINKRRQAIFDKDIRDAEREHDFMTDRELRG